MFRYPNKSLTIALLDEKDLDGHRRRYFVSTSLIQRLTSRHDPKLVRIQQSTKVHSSLEPF